MIKSDDIPDAEFAKAYNEIRQTLQSNVQSYESLQHKPQLDYVSRDTMKAKKRIFQELLLFLDDTWYEKHMDDK